MLLRGLTLPNTLKPTWKRLNRNIVPSDYYLFRSNSHVLAQKQFHSQDDIEKLKIE